MGEVSAAEAKWEEAKKAAEEKATEVQAAEVKAAEVKAAEVQAAEVKAAGYLFPYLYDESQAIAKAFHAACTPDIFLFDRQTRTLDPLPEANHPTAFDGFPKISPDGRFIVFESDRLHGRPKIFLFDRQTRTVSELSHANEATADDGLAAISN